MGGEKKKTVWGRVFGLYRSSNRAVRFSAWGLSVVAVLALAYLFFSLSYLARVYPNVVIGTHKFGGLTMIQLKVRLTELAASQAEQKITLRQGDPPSGGQLEFVPKDLEWRVDIEATANQVFGYGREEDNRLFSFFHQLKSPFMKSRFKPVASFNQDSLVAKVSQLADKVNRPAQNASAALVGDKLVIGAEKSGEVVEGPIVEGTVLSLLNSFTSGAVEMTLTADAPRIILASVDDLKQRLETLSDYELTLKWETGSKKLIRKDIRQLVGFIGQGLDGVTPQVLSAQFTTEKVQNYLTSIASQTDSPAVEPELVIKDGKLSIAKASRQGRVVDLNASAATILGVLATRVEGSMVELTMKTDRPVIDESNLAGLGIVERIGYGETSFAGSPANRRHNITNGVSTLQSALVKPGEIFSTVKKLGAVDNTTGYLPELVIKENRTTPEFGGGLCQVSTTLFRAILNAGLPVTERQNHSYRVSYYEPPIGLDATIYLPKPDLKFLNDTPAHILIQGRVVGNKVVFEFWGSGDGRSASTTVPIVSNVIQPGEPIYADTDTLPKGEQKQIEKPHAGATAAVTYTVTRGGQVINKQVFKSIYKVWPARFLVGTNALLPPSNPPQP